MPREKPKGRRQKQKKEEMKKEKKDKRKEETKEIKAGDQSKKDLILIKFKLTQLLTKLEGCWIEIKEQK